jgi:hypothetical protein
LLKIRVLCVVVFVFGTNLKAVLDVYCFAVRKDVRQLFSSWDYRRHWIV